MVDLVRFVQRKEALLAAAHQPLGAVSLRTMFPDAYAVVEVRQVDRSGFASFDGLAEERQPPLLKVQRGVLGQEPCRVSTVLADHVGAGPAMSGDDVPKPCGVVRVDGLHQVPLLRRRWVTQGAASILINFRTFDQFSAWIGSLRRGVHAAFQGLSSVGAGHATQLHRVLIGEALRRVQPCRYGWADRIGSAVVRAATTACG